MRNLGFLTAVVLLVATLAAFGWSGTMAGQEPPVGDQSEPDDDLMRQIAQLLLASYEGGTAGGVVGGEENPQLWDLIKQLQPDLTVTLGDGPVGGIAELPDTKGMSLQAADSTGPNTALIAGIAGIAVGVPALGGMAWYMRRRVVRGS